MTSQSATLEKAETGEAISWRDRVRALGPMVDAAAAADEDCTELSREVVDALDAAGIFAAAVPRVVGGGEADPTDVIDILDELSYWDPSAGWYAHAVMGSGSVAGSCLGPRAIEAIFPGGHYQRCAGGSNPGGVAERVGDSYRISGKFVFGSGTAHAAFLLGGYVVHEGGKPVIGANGQPLRMVGYVPREHGRFKGNWNVMGLRGTGSYDFEVVENVLHEDFFFTYPVPAPKRGGPFFAMGFLAQPALNIGAFALGAARRMLDEWKAYALARTRLNGQKVCEMPTYHRDIAIATAEHRSAIAYMKDTYAKLFDAAATDSISEEMKLDARLCTSHAMRVALEIARTGYLCCSTHALRNGNIIQRVFRDIHAGGAHSLTHESSFTDLGNVIGGGKGAKVQF